MSRPFTAGTLSLVLAAFLATPLLAREVASKAAPAVENQKPRIEIALLLDTSNSMDGLINQARTQLWKMVNELEGVRHNGQRPDVYVALYEYGNDGLAAEGGHIRLVQPLTLNLDKISEELFALTTNGGSEFCGQVIAKSLDDLQWTDRPGTMKCIFIAGNEPFTQGSVDYREACKNAASKNITITTIHCGSYDEGIQGKWADGAKLADGQYLNIDQDKALPHIEAPQDEELTRLNAALNKTYIPYGAEEARKLAVARQEAQDAKASQAAPQAFSGRIQTKASANYRNADWDLVDALKEKTVKLEEVKKDQLPEALRKLSPEELKTHVEKLTKERGNIQEKIKSLSAARNKHVAAEQAKLAATGEDTLDQAVVKAVRAEADKQGFEFVEE